MKTYAVLLFVLILVVMVVGCTTLPSTQTAISTPLATQAPTSTSPATQAPTNTPVATLPVVTPCALSPIVVPTRPAITPGYAELDPATGLHITGNAPNVDLASYHLNVIGNVDRPLSLTYDDLRCMPKITLRCTLTCPGYFQDEATWSGASLNYVLALARARPEAMGIELVSADGYSMALPLDFARSENGFLAYEWEGQPLPILHGFPVRAVLPASSGGYWVKWLTEIDVH